MFINEGRRSILIVVIINDNPKVNKKRTSISVKNVFEQSDMADFLCFTNKKQTEENL
jgi:hypothetical protein